MYINNLFIIYILFIKNNNIHIYIFTNKKQLINIHVIYFLNYPFFYPYLIKVLL